MHHEAQLDHLSQGKGKFSICFDIVGGDDTVGRDGEEMLPYNVSNSPLWLN